jgi:hypothetical protein
MTLYLTGLKGDKDSARASHHDQIKDQEQDGLTVDNISIKSDDTVSIHSDITESPYSTDEFLENIKFKNIIDGDDKKVKKMCSRESSPAPNAKRQQSAEKISEASLVHGVQNPPREDLFKSLEEFEKEVTEMDSKKSEVKNKEPLLNSEETEDSIQTASTSENEKTPSKSTSNDVQRQNESPKRSEEITSKDSVSDTEDRMSSLREGENPSEEKVDLSSPVSSNTSENSLLKSPDQKVKDLISPLESPADDFYNMYLSNSSVTSQKDVQYHPLLPSTTEDEAPEEDETLLSTKEREEEEPSYKVLNNWTELFTTGNLSCLCLTDTHIWHVDRSANLWQCSLNSPGLKWQKANGFAKMIAVSRSGNIVWRLYKDTVYAGTKITAKHPEGLKWIEAIREVQYIAVDETVAW